MTIHACSCVREDRRQEAGTAVCFILDTAYASHTLRVFLRDQGPGVVLCPISVEEAWRLIEPPADSDQAETSLNDDADR